MNTITGSIISPRSPVGHMFSAERGCGNRACPATARILRHRQCSVCIRSGNDLPRNTVSAGPDMRSWFIAVRRVLPVDGLVKESTYAERQMILVYSYDYSAGSLRDTSWDPVQPLPSAIHINGSTKYYVP